MISFWQKLNKPFSVLAPMDDVTDNVFRQIVVRAGRSDVLFTEFTNSDGLLSIGNKIVARKLTFTKDQKPIVAQIWGNNPESMYNAAKLVSKMGFDGIDINMGCPVREVVKKNAGAGLIGNYELALKIIKSTIKGAGDTPVSIKTRLGLNVNIASEWCEFLLKQNIAALTIHGRTAKQMSEGEANWDEIGKIVKIRDKVAPATLVIGNGDVKNHSEIIKKHKKYGVDGVMIGRGIFQNPWIFNPDNKVHTRRDYLDLLILHLNLFERTWGENKNFAVMKKFFKMYINNFGGASQLRIKLMETKSYNEARKIIASII